MLNEKRQEHLLVCVVLSAKQWIQMRQVRELPRASIQHVVHTTRSEEGGRVYKRGAIKKGGAATQDNRHHRKQNSKSHDGYHAKQKKGGGIALYSVGVWNCTAHCTGPCWASHIHTRTYLFPLMRNGMSCLASVLTLDMFRSRIGTFSPEMKCANAHEKQAPKHHIRARKKERSITLDQRE